MHDTGYTTVFLDEVLVEARAGCGEWEKSNERRIPLLVSVEMTTAQTEWPDRQLSAMIDYMRVYDHIMTWPGLPHRDFLEQIAEELLSFCFQDDRVMACRVRLKKPHVVANSKGLGIEIFRRR
jgi:FolB domain-containing protein